MPELPEVETVRRGLEPVLVGQAFARVEQRRPDLRLPLPKHFGKRLTGRKVEALDRRAKYLLVRLDNGEVLVVHLGMTGRFFIDGARRALGEFDQDDVPMPKHEHVVFHLGDGTSVRFNDARRFGLMDLVHGERLEQHALFKGLGMEPLSKAFTPAMARAASQGQDHLDQGRAPRPEIGGGTRQHLRFGGAPSRRAFPRCGKAGSLATRSGKPTTETKALVAAIRVVLEAAIKAGGSTLRDYAGADGRLGRFQHRFKVYDREGKRCAKKGCGGTVRRIVQGGRSTFYCPNCQR